jgi:hypothetical protein
VQGGFIAPNYSPKPKGFITMSLKQTDLGNGLTFNRLSQRVATVKQGKRRLASYFGFRTKRDAQKFVRAITKQQLCTKSELRKAERLDDWCNWEVKAWGCPTAFIAAMANRDRQQESA